MEMMGGRENMFDHTSGLDLMSSETWNWWRAKMTPKCRNIGNLEDNAAVHVAEIPFIRNYKFRACSYLPEHSQASCRLQSWAEQ